MTRPRAGQSWDVLMKVCPAFSPRLDIRSPVAQPIRSCSSSGTVESVRCLYSTTHPLTLVDSLPTHATGKSSLLHRYYENEHLPRFISTLGIDFRIKTVEMNGKRIKLQIVRMRFYIWPCGHSSSPRAVGYGGAGTVPLHNDYILSRSSGYYGLL